MWFQIACHQILIKSDTVIDTGHGNDSIIIVGHNKEQIKNAITTCLEEPLHQMLQEWLEDFKTETSNKSTSEIIAEIEAICKQMEFINRKYRDISSRSSRLNTKSIVPDEVKEYLFRYLFLFIHHFFQIQLVKLHVNMTMLT